MRALEIEANLLATCDKRTVAFVASGNSGVLSFSNWQRPAAGMLGIFPLSTRSRQDLLRLHRRCAELGMSLTVEVCGRAVAQLGDRCKPGIFSRLLGVHPVEVRVMPMLYALLRIAASGGRSERTA